VLPCTFLHREPCANPFSKQANKQSISSLSIGGHSKHICTHTAPLPFTLSVCAENSTLSLSHTSYSLPLCRGQKATRQQQLSFIFVVQKIQLSLSHTFSLCRQTSLLTLIFFASPHQTSRRQLPSLREQSSKHELSPPLCSCFSHHRRKLAPAPTIFFSLPPTPLQSNSRASSRAACHHGNEIELRSCTVAMTPASGRRRTGTAAPTPARSQTRSCSWCVARPGWSCTTPHTRRR